MNKDIKTFINDLDIDKRAIINTIRDLILSKSNNVIEQFKWSRPVYSINKDFCYLKATKKHVSIGFFDYEKIKTNTHLIEGTGKSMRHIKIKNIEEVLEYKLSEIIDEVLNN